jgi:hypothetical protein
MKNAHAEGFTLVPGQAYGGGVFVDAYMHGAERRALILAPRTEGTFKNVRWHKDYPDVQGALSYVDGLANTIAMADAGSELAQKIRALCIGDYDDWCLPALDQLELCYRGLKPGTSKNSCYARSGINLSSCPPAWPYTPEHPGQTALADFREGRAEAFETDDYYWTSTQHAAYSHGAWMQYFSGGYQSYFSKGYRCLARAVRSEPI